MSNLSDLLPAGAGAKSATFTASGTLATGQAVALKSDGTVTSITGKTGSSYVFEAAGTQSHASVFDSNSNKVVIAYQDTGNSNYGTAVVATVSGSTISYGTPAVFESASSSSITIVFDSSNNKVVISYQDAGNGYYGTSVVGTVSGTSITFGTPVVFASAFISTPASTFDSNANRVVIAFGNQISSYAACVVGTVSGTSISFGTKVDLANYGLFQNIVFDSTNNKVIILNRRNSDNLGEAYVGTVSGTSISYGTPVAYSTSSVIYVAAVFDSNSGKVVIAYDQGDTGTAIVGTVSGTSISFGSERVFTNVSVTINTNNGTFDSTNNVCLVLLKNDSTGYQEVVELSVSGTTTTQSGPFVVLTQTVSASGRSIAYDSNANKSVLTYDDGSNSNYGTAVVYDTDGVASADFVGITDQAIADTATGSVVVEGGVITNSTLVPFSVSSVGTPVVFNAGNTNDGCAAYDSSNNKVVIAYRDSSNNSHGTAIVGTVSGTSISFGSEVVFSAANTNNIGIAFDSSNNKVVIVYRDADTGVNDAIAIVGTVSGTSISFGSPTTYDSGGGVYNKVAYDSNAQKLVVVYSASNNSDYATAVVGTVSGTSISFGSAVVYESASSTYTDVAYDSDSQKVISTYRDAGNSNKGTAIVGTVSGTSISFGSPATFSTGGATNGRVAYDATAQKVVVVYRDEANSYSGAANVGTVSGTSISFGATVNFTNSVGADYPEVEYDPSGGGVVVTYTDGGNGNIGKAVFGTVSGTSISFTDAITYESSATYFTGSVYDANAQKMVAISKDGGNSNYGTAAVLTTSAPLTTGSTYYVQIDGSLSTTSSSVTAGKALSSTTLLLKG